MRFKAKRETMLQPLQQVTGVIERKQTLAVMANVLLEVDVDGFSLTGSDGEVELRSRGTLLGAEPGSVTVSGRKLFDIVRAMPESADVEVSLRDGRMLLKAASGRYSLMTIPASEYPVTEVAEAQDRCEVERSVLQDLLATTSFAMAAQDMRYYLNGLLFEWRPSGLRLVATDGHRLAIGDSGDFEAGEPTKQWIVPRKGVLELQRMLGSAGEEVVRVELAFGRNQFRVELGESTLISKLIDGKYPEYEMVVPIAAEQVVRARREELQSALERTSILSNEKYRGVRLEVEGTRLRISTANAEQEQGDEELVVDSKVSQLSIGFNVGYLLESLRALGGEEVLLCLRDGNSSALLKRPGSDRIRQVVMPLRL